MGEQQPSFSGLGRYVFALLIKHLQVLIAFVVVGGGLMYGMSLLGPPERTGNNTPVPQPLADHTTVLGLRNARFWGWYDTEGPILASEFVSSINRERSTLKPDEPLPPSVYLAISGGAADGAFGAGLLCGWHDRGELPKFKLVSGVSAGAMIAPLVFVGGKRIEQLRDIYTTISDADVRTMRALNGLYGVMFDDAMADSSPLYRLISKHFDQSLLDEIAVEYRKGRLLWIVTTNLDQQRPTVWNIGVIAASGKPEALELVRHIILASAAIPGAFPPVMFDVEAGGKKYQEMHVDGGVVAQTFLYPHYLGDYIDFTSGSFKRERNAYIIRNGRLDPDWAAVNRSFLTIIGRSISTLVHYLGYNDLIRQYRMTRRDGVGYNLAYIEPTFKLTRSDRFDPEYMTALYDYAYDKGKKGYQWHAAPPIYENERTE